MLYLAEVVKTKRGLSSRTDFKLLACQRSEQSWSAVPNEDIPAPDRDADRFGEGALVMLELSNNKQVQRYTDAGRQLVSILQNFSRQQDKSKSQEEEIEQWKESLTYQSQELNRREMEMEARREELERLEAEFAQLEEQRQTTEAAKQELDRLREDYERRSQELEGAWAQLQGAQGRLEEQQAAMQQSAGLDASQAGILQAIVERLTVGIAPTQSIQEQLNHVFELIAAQQNTLDFQWQSLQQQQTSAQEMQEEVNRQTQSLDEQWQAWHEAQAQQEQMQIELQSKQEAVIVRQNYARLLTTQVQGQNSLHQQLTQLSSGSVRINREELERLSIEELQTIVTDLERDLEKMSRFVSSQEEELTLQQEAITELRQHISQASEYDRMRLETELADEQDRYKMLNETLVGQRRNLLEREAVLKQHQNLLARRQGLPSEEEATGSIDLSVALVQLDQLRQQQIQELQTLEAEIQQLQASLSTTQTSLDQQMRDHQAQRQELQQRDQALRAQVAAVGELWGKVNTYQETLQPMQEAINGLRQQAEEIARSMHQLHEAGPTQAIAELQSVLQSLTNNSMPELAVS